MNHIILLCAGAVIASGLSWTVGNIQGRASATVECEQARVKAATSALDDWRAAVEVQAAADRAQSLKDAAAIEKATAKLNESARKFERIKAAAIPAGNCVLSAEWVRAYDEAR